MVKEAYSEGVKAAAQILGLDPKVLELAGLGLIAAPSLHGLLTREEDTSPTTKKLLHASDLAGLGLLAAPHLIPH